MAQNGRQNGGKNSGKQPYQNPYARSGSGSRVPSLDAFDDVHRLPPPQNGRTHQQSTRGQQSAGRGTAPQAPPRQRAGGQAGKKAAPAKRGGGAPKRAPAKASKQPPKKRTAVDKKKLRRNRRIAAFFAVLMLIGAGVWFSVAVLFKIDTIRVEGDSPYAADEILAAFAREPGDNMFGFKAADSQKTLEQGMPYLESVRVQRKLPSTVVINVQAATETYCIEVATGYAVLSESLKVLRVADTPQTHLTRLYGLSSLTVTPGITLAVNGEAATEEEARNALLAEQAILDAQQQNQPESTPDLANPDEGADPDDPGDEPIDGEPQDDPENTGNPEGEDENGADEPVANEPEPVATYEPDTSRMYESTPAERWDTLLLMMKALEAAGFEDITWVSVADVYDMEFRWQDRITVKLGTKTELAAKLAYVAVMLTDQSQNGVGENERGTLDASTYATTNSAWFSSD